MRPLGRELEENEPAPGDRFESDHLSREPAASEMAAAVPAADVREQRKRDGDANAE
jgi:hypothetical protein